MRAYTSRWIAVDIRPLPMVRSEMHAMLGSRSLLFMVKKRGLTAVSGGSYCCRCCCRGGSSGRRKMNVSNGNARRSAGTGMWMVVHCE